MLARCQREVAETCQLTRLQKIIVTGVLLATGLLFCGLSISPVLSPDAPRQVLHLRLALPHRRVALCRVARDAAPEHASDRGRTVAAVVYAASIVLTLLAALRVRSAVLTAVFVVAQIAGPVVRGVVRPGRAARLQSTARTIRSPVSPRVRCDGNLWSPVARDAGKVRFAAHHQGIATFPSHCRCSFVCFRIAFSPTPETLWLGRVMKARAGGQRERGSVARGQALWCVSPPPPSPPVCAAPPAGTCRARGAPQTADAVEADFECLMSHWSVISMFTLFLAEIEQQHTSRPSSSFRPLLWARETAKNSERKTCGCVSSSSGGAW